MDELQAILDSENQFLASYIMAINGSQSVIDDRNPLDVEDYYDVEEEELDDESSSIFDDDFEYGFDPFSSEEDDFGFEEDDYDDQSFLLDYFLGDSSTPYLDENNASRVSGPGNLKDEIAYKESRGRYDVTNPNSSAAGKYQFLWNTWKGKIGNVTGIKTKQEFLNNPQAQEQFYTWYEKNEMAPAVERLQQYNKAGYTPAQLGKLFHFRGEKGARNYLLGKVPDKPEAYNSSISEYIRQAGGPVPIANTEFQQYVGLNDDSFDELLLPLNGQNVIRGLDSGQPVMITDSTGRQQILSGPADTTLTTGKVYEKRLINK